MEKSSPIQLAIPSPCSENWNAMTPDAQGKFCAHCQKSVIDFTGGSDRMLYDFFAQNNSNVCGRLRFDQLNRSINIPPQPHSKLYRIAIALGLTILVAQAHDAQARVQPPLTEQNLLTAQKNDSTGADSIIIKGQVLDEKKEPMIGAAVTVMKPGNIIVAGAPTDIDGYFSMSLPKSQWQDKYLLVGVSFTGYKSKKLRFETEKETVIPYLTILLEIDNFFNPIHIIGGISNRPPLVDPQNPSSKKFTTSDLHHMGY